MYKIIIIISERMLYIYKDMTLIKCYKIAIGKPSTPTPVGNFKILQKIKNPGGPFGTRWMRFYKSYGIHGTNNPSSIGKDVSNGCVRMYNKDVEEVYDLVTIGSPVQIIN